MESIVSRLLTTTMVMMAAPCVAEADAAMRNPPWCAVVVARVVIVIAVEINGRRVAVGGEAVACGDEGVHDIGADACCTELFILRSFDDVVHTDFVELAEDDLIGHVALFEFDDIFRCERAAAFEFCDRAFGDAGGADAGDGLCVVRGAACEEHEGEKCDVDFHGGRVAPQRRLCK